MNVLVLKANAAAFGALPHVQCSVQVRKVSTEHRKMQHPTEEEALRARVLLRAQEERKRKEEERKRKEEKRKIELLRREARQKPFTNHHLPPVFVYGDSQVLQLPDGGQLGWAQLGRSAANGPVWVMFHGKPGSRFDYYKWPHKYAEQHGIRLFCVDRPGYGNSKIDGIKTVLDFMKPVQYLLETQKVSNFKVYGLSGGGPYALACAYWFPKNQLKATAIMAGSNHPKAPASSIGTKWRYHRMHARWSPLTYQFFHKDDAPQWLAHQEWELMKNFPNDARFIEERMAVHKETAKQELEGATRDAIRNASNWNFKLEDIRANPIMWYHGNIDVNCSLSAAQWAVNRIRSGGKTNASLKTFPEQDHYSAQDRYRELFDWLRKQ